MSKVGSLNKRISIYRPKITFDGMQNVSTFEKIAEVFASATPVSDAERFRANAAQSTSMVRFSIRKPRSFEVDNTCRIAYDGWFYDVNGAKAELDVAYFEITAVQMERVQ